jgi:outer membrane receptor protein involved in Fe transport
LRIGPATLVDARASWTSGRATLFGYVRNLFDAFYLRAMFNSSVAVAHGPREIGIGVEGRF